jgi:hypothetical protein
VRPKPVLEDAMKNTMKMTVAAAALAAACGGSVEGEKLGPSITTSTEHAARFVGEWTITYQTDRDSSATFTLASSGAIEIVRRGSGTPLEDIATRPGSGIRCEVGTRWHSAGSSMLVFEATACSDGVPRDVNIAFPGDPSGNASYDLAVEVASVGGEGGWKATEFNGPWGLRRCPRADCR